MVGKKRLAEVPEEDEAFPRGGGDGLTPLEKRQLSVQAQADFEQEQSQGGDKSRQNKRKKRGTDVVSLKPRARPRETLCLRAGALPAACLRPCHCPPASDYASNMHK